MVEGPAGCMSLTASALTVEEDVLTALDQAKNGTDMRQLETAISNAKGKVPKDQVDAAEVILNQKDLVKCLPWGPYFTMSSFYWFV